MTHKVLVLDPTGHSEYAWEDQDEGGVAVLEAEKVFDQELAKGSAAFATSVATPGVAKRVKSFQDAKAAEEVIIVPPFVGG